MDIKTKSITRDKEGHYLIKRSIQEEDMAIANIYAPMLHTKKILTDNGRN